MVTDVPSSTVGAMIPFKSALLRARELPARFVTIWIHAPGAIDVAPPKALITVDGVTDTAAGARGTVILRIFTLLVSATYRFPLTSTASPEGKFSGQSPRRPRHPYPGHARSGKCLDCSGRVDFANAAPYPSAM